MPDIQFFDTLGFFNQKITATEQILIGKQAEREILLANRANLEETLATMAQLSPEHQRALQPELASLKEVLQATERSLATLDGEIAMLSDKLAALQTARELLPVQQSR